MKRKLFCMLIASFALGCVVTAVSPHVFVYETEDVHKQLMTYEKGLPFPYVIETARVARDGLYADFWWDLDPYYTRTVRYEILAVQLLSSVISNTFAVAGIIGIIFIGEKKSSLKVYRLRDQ